MLYSRETLKAKVADFGMTTSMFNKSKKRHSSWLVAAAEAAAEATGMSRMTVMSPNPSVGLGGQSKTLTASCGA